MFSVDQSMVIKSIVGVVAGLLVASGHLNASNSDVFTNDTSALGGTLITVISLIYLLEHQFEKVKADLKNPTPVSEVKTTQQTPQDPTQSSADSSASSQPAASVQA